MLNPGTEIFKCEELLHGNISNDWNETRGWIKSWGVIHITAPFFFLTSVLAIKGETPESKLSFSSIRFRKHSAIEATFSAQN